MTGTNLHRSESLPRLAVKAVARMVAALSCLVQTALRPVPHRAERMTALLLLGSMALLALGVLLVPNGSSLLTAGTTWAGIVGLLISGYLGTQHDTTVDQSRGA